MVVATEKAVGCSQKVTTFPLGGETDVSFRESVDAFARVIPVKGAGHDGACSSSKIYGAHVAREPLPRCRDIDHVEAECLSIEPSIDRKYMRLAFPGCVAHTPASSLDMTAEKVEATPYAASEPPVCKCVRLTFPAYAAEVPGAPSLDMTAEETEAAPFESRAAISARLSINWRAYGTRNNRSLNR